MSGLLFFVLFGLNFCVALGLRVFASEAWNRKWFGNRVYRVLFLIPPLSILIAGVLILYGILYSIYLTLWFYFSDNV